MLGLKLPSNIIFTDHRKPLVDLTRVTPENFLYLTSKPRKFHDGNKIKIFIRGLVNPLIIKDNINFLTETLSALGINYFETITPSGKKLLVSVDNYKDASTTPFSSNHYADIYFKYSPKRLVAGESTIIIAHKYKQRQFLPS